MTCRRFSEPFASRSGPHPRAPGWPAPSSPPGGLNSFRSRSACRRRFGDRRYVGARSERAGPRPSHTARSGGRHSASVQCTLKLTPRRCSAAPSRSPARRPVVDVIELAVDRHPVVQALGSMHHLPHVAPAGRRCRSLHGDLAHLRRRSARRERLDRFPVAQRALDRRVEASAGARRAVAPRGRRAAAGRCRGPPSAARSARGPRRRSRPRRGRDRRDAATAEPERRPADQHRVADPLDQLAVAQTSGPADVSERPARSARVAAARGTRARRARRSAACGARARPAARARAGARSAARGSGTSASARRSRSRRAARPSPARPPAAISSTARRLARWREDVAVGRARGRRGRRSAARPPRCAAAAKRSAARRSRVGERRAGRAARSIEWIR